MSDTLSIDDENVTLHNPSSGRHPRPMLIEPIPIERGLKASRVTSLERGAIQMTTDPLVQFGRRLVELRLAQGWSQERLAHESGLARSYLGGVERGRRNLALLNIYKLAQTLGVEPHELLFPPQTEKDRDENVGSI